MLATGCVRIRERMRVQRSVTNGNPSFIYMESTVPPFLRYFEPINTRLCRPGAMQMKSYLRRNCGKCFKGIASSKK